MDAVAWAHGQFWGAPLGDLRLRRRLVEVAACIRENPCGTLPRAIGNAAALKGAYRLFGHPEATHENILRPHVERTRADCRQPGGYLLIEDTTALSFTQRGALAGLGPLTDAGSQGLLAHTCLALRIEGWSDAGAPQTTLCGLFGQRCWARQRPQGSRKERSSARRKKASGDASLESGRWALALRETQGPPAGVSWSLIADRECDIFETLAQCQRQGAGWVVRAAQPRKTALAGRSVFEAAAQAPVLGSFTLPLRARPGAPARQARVELRAVATEVLPPRERHACGQALRTGLLEARETDPPPGASGIHWLLLTSWPCQTYAQARRAANAYACPSSNCSPKRCPRNPPAPRPSPPNASPCSRPYTAARPKAGPTPR